MTPGEGAAGPESRLAEADGLRDGDAAARARAVAAYRDLGASLDPSRPGDAARLRWLFENDPRRDAAMGALADRAAAGPDADLRRAATLVLGQVASDAGRPGEAEALFRGLLEEHRGSGHRFERLACLALARLFALQRRVYEAMVMARGAAALARKAGPAFDLCLARARMCMALQSMEDAKRLSEAVEELDRSLASIPPERARSLRALVHACRAEAALEGGDLPRARAEATALLALATPGEGVPGDRRLPHYLLAEAASREGKYAEALASVERAREIPARTPASDLPLLHLEARCLLETGRAEEARRRLEGLLDILEGDPDAEPVAGDPLVAPAVATGPRIRYADEAGRMLADRCASPADARRAFDLAAGWALRRIVEVGRSMARIPELAGIVPEDLRALTDYRNRYVKERAGILDRLAALYGGEAPPEGLLTPDPAGEEEGFFRACAWCRRVRTADGRWLPVGEFLPDDRKLRISHGICPGCRARWIERSRAAPGAPPPSA